MTVAACAGDDEDATSCGPSAPLSSAEESHACTHVEAGPFVFVTARSSTSEVAPPEISRTHVVYTVSLAGDSPPHTGTVAIRARRPGAHSIFFSSGAEMRLPAVTCSRRSPLDTCNGLAGVVLVDLPSEGSYDVEIAAPQKTVRIILERR